MCIFRVVPPIPTRCLKGFCWRLAGGKTQPEQKPKQVTANRGVDMVEKRRGPVHPRRFISSGKRPALDQPDTGRSVHRRSQHLRNTGVDKMPVRASLAELSISFLRMPGENSTMIRWIVC